MDPARFPSRWDPEDERHPDTATPVVFADDDESAFAAPGARVHRAELDPRYASICRPFNVFWGNNKYTAAQIKDTLADALRQLPPHPQPSKSPIHHHYPVLRQALDHPIKQFLHGGADPDLAVGSAVLWNHIDDILGGRTSASGEARYSSDVMIQFGIKMVTSGTRCHYIAGDHYLKGTRDYDVKTPSKDYHRVRTLRLGAFALTANNSSHWTAVIHHIVSGTTYVFDPAPRSRATRWAAHIDLRVNLNKFLVKWRLPPTSLYVVMGGQPQLGSWECGYVLLLQFMSFLHNDGMLQWDQSSLYRGLETAQARQAYGMRKIADWAIHLWTGEDDLCSPSPEVSELLSASERLVQTKRINSLKSRYPLDAPEMRVARLLSSASVVSLLRKGAADMPDLAKLGLFGRKRKRITAPPDLSVLRIAAGASISKRPAIRKRVSALSSSPALRRAMGRPYYPHFTPDGAGWERPDGLKFDVAGARAEVLANYADSSFRKSEGWPKASETKGDEVCLGGELGRAYTYLLTMVFQNPGRATKIGLSPASVRDRGGWVKLVTALIIKKGNPVQALQHIGRCYPHAP